MIRNQLPAIWLLLAKLLDQLHSRVWTLFRNFEAGLRLSKMYTSERAAEFDLLRLVAFKTVGQIGNDILVFLE